MRPLEAPRRVSALLCTSEYRDTCLPASHCAPLVSPPTKHQAATVTTGEDTGQMTQDSLGKSSCGIFRYFGGRPILEREELGPWQGLSACSGLGGLEAPHPCPPHRP